MNASRIGGASPWHRRPRAPGVPTGRVRLRFWTQLALQTARLMVGITDYQTYVRHQQTFHRGDPVMTYIEFFWERQAACYAVEKGRVRGIC